MITKSSTLLLKYSETRFRTEYICKPLKTEDYVVQPIVDVSPPKWHLGHTTWFFETFLLKEYLTDYEVFNVDFNYLFNSYYESVGARVIRTDRGNITRPSVDEVMAYRAYVDQHMSLLLNSNLNQKEEELVVLGLQHEQQHQELLIYDIKYILGKNPLFPAYELAVPKSISDVKPMSWYDVEAGIYKVGFEGKGFSFDNEHGRHQVYLEQFVIADRLTTNGEYLDFMNDGGYTNFKYWLSDAWEWVSANAIQAPEHWHFQEGKWYQYNLKGGLQLVDINTPVTHISFYEADAYAKWKELRLPTEFEWEVACKMYGKIDDQSNLGDSNIFSPQQASVLNNQFFGDVWEWTASAYRPYPFYEAPEGAVGEYNGKFMINQMILRGGSCATPKNHIRVTYRNFFHPQLRWMFSGIRLAKHV
jgi:ergothioneine biosynthesis protein EgtB